MAAPHTAGRQGGVGTFACPSLAFDYPDGVDHWIDADSDERPDAGGRTERRIEAVR